MSPAIEKLAWMVLGGAIAFGLRALYDWLIQPAIAKSQRRAERREREAEEKRQRERQNRLDELNAAWKQSREALRSAQGPLKEFNAMNRYPDTYRAPRCAELATQIEEAAMRIDGAQYADIKKKLLEYAARRAQINVNTPLRELTEIFQRIAGEIFEPLALAREIDGVLEKTAGPPFSESEVHRT